MKNRLYYLLSILCGLIIVCSEGLVFSSQIVSFQEPALFPSLISSIRVDEPLDFCGEPVPVHIFDIKERLEKELLLSIWNRPQVILWIKRAGQFFPHIERMLKQYNMPDDLKYIPIVESALRAHAGSSKGAIGFWQFMKATGKRYDLTVNQYTDERRNLFASTLAAINYLKDLYVQFQSWSLAAAAYNMGEDGLETEIITQKVKDYYKLYLPLETQRYIFKIISAKLIMSNPSRFGFWIKDSDIYPALQFDRIRLHCIHETPVQIIAESANTFLKDIKDLNPEIRGYYLPKGHHTLLIPLGQSQFFHKKFDKLITEWQSSQKEHIYIVQQGDNLSNIAERFNVPLPALLIWNRLSLRKHIHPGDRLIIYPHK